MTRDRAPIDTSGGRPTTTAELDTAARIVTKSGVLGVLAEHFENLVGRPRTLPLAAFLVAAQLNALARHHVGHLVEIARVGGRIDYHGVDLYDPKVSAVEVRRRIGMVFQKPNPFPKSIYDNVSYGPRVAGLAKKGEALTVTTPTSPATS